MDKVHYVSVSALYNVTQVQLDMFDKVLQTNLGFLQEFVDAAKETSASDGLLPKTPRVKRKRQVVKPPAALLSPNSSVVVLVDRHPNSKKMKIDVSSLDDSSMHSTINRNSSRQRKRRSSIPIRRSKRVAAQKNNKTSMLESTLSKSKTVLVIDDSPIAVAPSKTVLVIDDSPIAVAPNNLASAKTSSPLVNTVQPKVAALIEQLKLSTQKPVSMTTSPSSPRKYISSMNTDKVKQTLFNCTEQMDADEDSPSLARCNEEEKEKREEQASLLVLEDNVSSFKSSLCDMQMVKPIQTSSPCGEVATVGNAFEYTVLEDKMEDAQVCNEEVPEIVSEAKTPVPVPEVEARSVSHIESTAVDASNDDCNKKGPRIVKPLKGGNILSNTSSLINKQKVEPKDPGIVYHGNIVSGIKTFFKQRTTTPKKDTMEERQRKRIAELKKKEELRQKLIDEQFLNKQKLRDEQKRLREERKKRFIDQQAERQREEEKRIMQLEEKEQHALNNREELRKQRELEEKKKRKIREMKIAEAEARRQKEEEESKRRVAETLEEEKRREEILRQKLDFEENERQRRRIEQEKVEKERLRLVEEERLLDEDRKRREFAEREQHRLDVEKKFKEKRENDKIEKLMREKKLKALEKAGEQDRKQEQEKEKAKAKLREDIKSQMKTEKQLKGGQFVGKMVMNMQSYSKSPRLNRIDPFKIPVVATDSPVRSPATFVHKTTWNPPVIPLAVRESVFISYGLEDLGSDDSTDDECEPMKTIPSWARGLNLQRQLHMQHHAKIEPDLIFVNALLPCSLEKIFQKKKERYFKRTSSAHWASPMLKTAAV